LPSRASPLPQCPGLIKECVHTTNPCGSGLACEGVSPDNVYLRANPQQSPAHCPASSPPATTPSRSTDKSPSPDAVVCLPGCPPDPAAECSPTKREGGGWTQVSRPGGLRKNRRARGRPAHSHH